MEFNACVIVDEDKILIKFANRGVSSGKWDFPGGKLDQGESAEQSVIREVREETGLALTNVSYRGKIEWHFDEEKIMHTGHIFFSDGFKGTLRSNREEGEVKWVPKRELPKFNLWKDTLTWLPYVFKPQTFYGEVHYNNKFGDIIKSIDIKTRKLSKIKT